MQLYFVRFTLLSSVSVEIKQVLRTRLWFRMYQSLQTPYYACFGVVIPYEPQSGFATFQAE
jgi:hypothetical protein